MDAEPEYTEYEWFCAEMQAWNARRSSKALDDAIIEAAYGEWNGGDLDAFFVNFFYDDEPDYEAEALAKDAAYFDSMVEAMSENPCAFCDQPSACSSCNLAGYLEEANE